MATNPEATFKCTLGDDAFRFRRMHGREELGRLPEYRIELMRSQRLEPVAAERLLGTQATVKLLRPGGQFRYVNGWITAVDLGGAIGRYDLYRVELKPWLWHLTLGADCRIFQDKTVVDILQAVFGDYSNANVDMTKLSGTLRSRPYCVQYRESDYEFISRLMEEDGLWYFFTHAEGQHTMVLCNDGSAHTAMPEGSLTWSHAGTQDQKREDVITTWRYKQQLRSLKFTHDDYDHEAPPTALKKDDLRSVGYPTPGDLEVYDWPGSYAFPGQGTNDSQGTKVAKVAVDRFESGHIVASAASPCRSLTAGSTFDFTGHPNNAGAYLVIGVVFEVDIGDEEASSGTRGFGFSSRVQLVPKAARYAPEARTPKPIARGPQTATVVGPAGDEIHTDRFGRVKVHFRWDRVGPKNEHSTCFIRVATAWASKAYGMVSLPRIGDEVVVSFLEGNPDRPLVTGSVYNGDNMPPYTLPAQATVSGVRSRSSKGGGASNFNEMRFDDKAGSEYVWLRAEKDFHRMVKNDATDEVGRNQQVEIGKNSTTSVGEAYDLSIGKAAQISVGADTGADVGGDLNISVGGGTSLAVGSALDFNVGAAAALTSGTAMELKAGSSFTVEAASTVHIKAAAGVVIDGGVSLTIKAGGSFIVIDPSGVSIVGPMVKNNSGGSGGSAKSATKANPTKPKAPARVSHKNDPIG